MSERKKKLTIMQISDSDFWGMGKNKGILGIYLPLQECVKRGYDVHYILSTEEYRGKGIHREEYNGIHLYWFSLPLRPSRIRVKFLRIIAVKLYTFLFAARGFFLAYGIAKRVRPDVIYGGQARGAIVAFLIGSIRRVPTISRFYGTFLCRARKNPLHYLYMFDEVIAWKVPAACRLITDDGTGGDAVARALGVPRERVVFWRDGVEDTRIASPLAAQWKQEIGIAENAKVVLSMSRLVRWKRVDRVIRAIPGVVARRGDVVFLVVGDGPRRTSLEELADRLRVRSFVRFVGAVDRTEVKKFLNVADLFVCLSELSSLSNPVFEAMRCGKCVIGADEGETRTVIRHGENGFLIAPNDAVMQRELPNLLVNLLDNDALRYSIGHAALRYARDHFISPQERARKEVDLLENLAHEHLLIR